MLNYNSDRLVRSGVEILHQDVSERQLGPDHRDCRIARAKMQGRVYRLDPFLRMPCEKQRVTEGQMPNGIRGIEFNRAFSLFNTAFGFVVENIERGNHRSRFRDSLKRRARDREREPGRGASSRSKRTPRSCDPER